MKKLVSFLFLILVVLSCSKTLEINVVGKEDRVDNLVFTNTVSFSDKVYKITELDIYLEKNNPDSEGYDEPIFCISGEARKYLSSGGNSTMSYTDYEFVPFELIIPMSNYGKFYNLNDKNTYGTIAFGNGWATEVKTDYSVQTTSHDIIGSFFENTMFGTRSGIVVNDEMRGLGSPKKAKYYFDVVGIYKDTYQLYVEYEDANGNSYRLSYKGEKNYQASI